MKLNEVYAVEQAKWDDVSRKKATDEGINRLSPGEDFTQFSKGSSTHIGVVEFLGDLRGKSVLEFGCGTGQISMLLAKSGAQVTAFDLSSESVKITCLRAKVNDLQDRVHLVICPGESLPFTSESFDIIFGKAILHHLSVSHTQFDLYRMLKPGGKGVFIEPMGMNPLLTFARDHLPYLDKNPRGLDRPLNYDDIHAWGRSFTEFRFCEIQLVGMLRRGLGIKGGLRAFIRLDDLLLSHFPSLRRFCRYVVMYMVK